MSSNKLEEMLKKIKGGKQSEKSESSEDHIPNGKKLKKVENIKATVALSPEDKKGLGFIDGMKTRQLESAARLRAQATIFDTENKKLEHQAAAAERGSRAYWDAKSVDFAEGIKTYAQQSMQALEDARLENKSEVLITVREKASKRMQSIMEKDIPEQTKFELIEEMMALTDETVERIKRDTLANKYELGPE